MVFPYVIIFILGLCVGSFINVVIDRLPKAKSIIFGRSYCDWCKKKILWYDLIPVLSFIILQKRCRFCHKKISWQYPLVEITTGILFIFTYIFSFSNYQSSITNYLSQLIYYLLIISGLIAIFFTDLKYRIIPDQILAIVSVAALIYQIVVDIGGLQNHFLAALVFFLFFLLLVIITRGKGMGLGDVKFAFVMGFLLGMPKVVIAFYLSFLTGAIFSLILVMIGKKKMKSTIPFGPFLSGATAVSFYYGDVLWNIFRKIIGI